MSMLENPIDQKKYETENYKNISINKAMLENVLSDFNIRGNISSFKQGPIVTLYELKPAQEQRHPRLLVYLMISQDQ